MTTALPRTASSTAAAVVQTLHAVLTASGGQWVGGPTALHEALAETARGPILSALPLTPAALTRVLVELAEADEDEHGLRVVRISPRRWAVASR